MPSAGLAAGVFVGAGYPNQAGAEPSQAVADRTEPADVTVHSSASPSSLPAPSATVTDLNRQVESSAAAASAVKPKKAREQRTRPLHMLTQEEVDQFFAKCDKDVDWLLQNATWIRQDRDVRLRAMVEWAQFNDKASLAVTYFLAIEKDAQMRATQNGSTNAESRQTTAPAVPTTATAAAEAGDVTSSMARSDRPSTPPSDSIRDLLAVGKDLASTRGKRKLSPNSTKAEDARLGKSMRQLTGADASARSLARQRISAAQCVLANYGDRANDADESMRAGLVVNALGTPQQMMAA